MQSKWMRRLGLAAITGAVAYASVGCAQERDPINQVQPNALSKHFFVGADLVSASDDPEFYSRNTVVDVPYGAAQDGLFTASYAQPPNRIKWEIQEQVLIARQTYEHIADSDHKGTKATNDGQVVAMFAIQSHFDIRRSYNPATGEENNLITENTTDRPWNEREYFRVDWSKNMVTDGYEVDSLSQIGLYGGVKFDPMSYFVEDKTDPNAPVFAPEEGYFDITTKAFATPQMVDTPWGAFPGCYFFGTFPAGNCNPTEVTLRLSFRKIVDTDFEPSEWDGNRMDAFGAFYQERYGYERNYGVLDQNWHRLASKYNIWERSHISGKAPDGKEQFAQCNVDFWRDDQGNVLKYKMNGDAFVTDGKTGLPIPDVNGKPFASTTVAITQARQATRFGMVDTNGNKTDDECEFHDKDGNLLHQGARCDQLAHRCSMPFHERTIKTIPWYYAPGSPADLFASTSAALDQWNVAAKVAAQVGQMVDARRYGGDPSAYITDEDRMRGEEGKSVTNIFVLCHSPVIDTDDKACGKVGTVARIGDLRYNSVNVLQNPQTPSPWGIMVDADDPITGEKIVTSVNEWGHVLDIASQGTEDLLRWINGEISDADITSGNYLKQWAASSKLGTAQHQPQTLGQNEIKARLASLHPAVLKAGAASQVSLKGMTGPQIQDITNANAKEISRTMGPSIDAKFEGVRQSLIGTKFESMLATPEMLQAAGYDPQQPTAGDDNTLSRASILRGRNPEMRTWIRRMKDKAAARHGSCEVEQPEPDSLVGLARQAQRLYPLPNDKDPNYPALKFKRDNDLHQWIREQFHIAVILHEMGHSMGLRHNFTGSWDSLNYHTEYWQLRTRNGAEKACVNTDGTDYPLKAHTNGEDCVGPRWVDPVTDAEVNGLIWKWGSSTVMDYPGDQTQDMNGLGKYDKAFMRFLYTDVVDVDTDSNKGNKKSDYQSQLDGFGGISGPLNTYHYSEQQDRFKVLGSCSAQTDPKDPLSAKCTGINLDYVSVTDMKNAGTGPRDAQFAIDPQGRVRHPYMFGSDEYADFGNIPVFRFDAGADAYEQNQFLTTTYENRYIFDNFRRNRVMFTSEGTISRDMDRYFDKMTASTKALALYLSLDPQYKQELISGPGYLMPHALASAESLSTFIRVLTRPEPGDYSLVNGNFAEVASGGGGVTGPTVAFSVGVGSGEGRYINNDYDYSKGYNWGSYQTQVGSYYEKVGVIYYMTEAYNHFVQNSKQDYVDGRYLNLNYASLYPDQMRRIFANVMQNDAMTLGPYVTPPTGQVTTSNIARVQYLPWDKYSADVPGSMSLAYPAGTVTLNPLVGWQEQYPALIYGFIFGQTTLTMDWVQQMRIFSPGGSETISVPLSQQYRYQDPMTGLEYVAIDYGKESMNNTQVARTSGARMLEYANNLAKQTFQTTGSATQGELTYVRDPATNEARCLSTISPDDCAAAKTKLRGFSANIDTLRDLSRYIGYGPL